MMSIVTTVDNEFLENFHLLYNEKHDNNTLKFYCPYIDANSMSFESLINSLMEAAGHYCLSRRTWEEYKNKPMRLSRLVREKFRKLSGNKGELGELLMFSFLESDLNAPKLLSKMELKTNPNNYFNGADGVHYLKVSDGNYQLIYGESKVYSDLKNGIKAAISSIHDFKYEKIKDDESGELRGIRFEKGLLNAFVTNEAFTQEDCEFVKSLIYPKASAKYNVDTAFAIFVLFNIDIDQKEKKRSSDDFRKWLFDILTQQITKMIPSILKLIEEKELSGHSIYFYLLPMEKLDENREQILKEVVG